MSGERETDIELRSEEFQDVLGGAPSWIVRWGITMLGVIVVIIIAGSAIFKYPDVISAQITVTGSTPPALIIARSSGKIRELCVGDNQQVKAGDYLAVIDNPAQTEDVGKLKKILAANPSLEKWRKFDIPQKDTVFFSLDEMEGTSLGSLQPLYSQYYTAFFQYSEYKRLLYYPQKIDITGQRIAAYEQQYENLQKQHKLIEEQAGLQKNQHQRDMKLHETGVVSAEELEKSRSQYLQSELSLENMKSTLNNMRIQIGQLKESLLDTHYQDTEALNRLQTSLQTLETQLKAAIEEWELAYVLKAPMDGRVTFTSYWAVNQNITSGSEVFAVVNISSSDELDGDGTFIGKALLPIARSGKVKAGQRVNIRLENFPENEFGILQGRVKNISLVPVGTGTGQATNSSETAYYTIDIELPDGLTTTYKKELPFLPNMQGRADVVTEDVSLLERFFLPIKKVISEGMK